MYKRRRYIGIDLDGREPGDAQHRSFHSVNSSSLKEILYIKLLYHSFEPLKGEIVFFF